jgi:predicted RNase H-like HicB family nuclease
MTTGRDLSQILDWSPEGSAEGALVEGRLPSTQEGSTMKYYVVYERADDGGWGAYPPDIPGVGVVGETLDEARDLVRTAIDLQLEELQRQGLPIPEPSGEFVEVAV